MFCVDDAADATTVHPVNGASGRVVEIAAAFTAGVTTGVTSSVAPGFAAGTGDCVAASFPPEFGERLSFDRLSCSVTFSFIKEINVGARWKSIGTE